MKFYFFLCLLLAPLWVDATIQITANADIAPQLSLTDYTVVQSGSYYISGNCSHGPWSDPMSYAFSETYAGGTNLDFSGISQGGFVGPYQCFPCGFGVPVVCLPCPTNSSSTQSTSEDGRGLILYGGFWGATITGTTISGTYIDNFTNTGVNLQWGWENANYTASIPLPLQGGSENISRTVVTVLKLQTGGGSGSKLRNVFGMSLSAQQVAPMFLETCDFVNTPDPASICGNTLFTNGPISIQTNWWTVLPDNASVVVTPVISRLNDYTFNLSDQKYGSYLTVFVCQPYPDFPNDAGNWGADGPPFGYPVWRSGVNAGHVWYRLSSDASTNIINEVTSGSVNLEYVGVQVGYGPTETLWNPFTHELDTSPGELPWPNSDSPTVTVTYNIGFWSLISGLKYTENVHNNPGTYTIPSCTCVTTCAGVGTAVGITLPTDTDPEDFGFDLPPINQ